jgi:hypothetical protein
MLTFIYWTFDKGAEQLDSQIQPLKLKSIHVNKDISVWLEYSGKKSKIWINTTSHRD